MLLTEQHKPSMEELYDLNFSIEDAASDTLIHAICQTG